MVDHIKARPKKKHWFEKQAPEHAEGWYQFHDLVSNKGILDEKTKELVAVASGALSRCEHCVKAHATGAIKAGASKAEIAEAIMIASQTASGSHLFWTPVYEELIADTDQEEASTPE